MTGMSFSPGGNGGPIVNNLTFGQRVLISAPLGKIHVCTDKKPVFQ
jgi:hypothetical protein